MKLSREQFDSAIRKGLGRAYLYVREHGDAEVRDILLNALTHNLVYADYARTFYKTFKNKQLYIKFL